MLRRREVIKVVPNLTVRLKRDDKTLEEQRVHNVFVDLGRDWLSKLVGAASYPALSSIVNMKDTDIPTSMSLHESWVTPPDKRTYRTRWIGVGTGGYLQTAAIPGQGGYTEIPTINGVENPVWIRESSVVVGPEWMGEVLSQDTSDPLDFPETGTIVFRRLFAETEISFIDSGGNPCQDYQGNLYGTTVPVTEVALFTSEADPFSAPHVNVFGGDVPGLQAYGLINPIYKTPLVALEVIWEISFK